MNDISYKDWVSMSDKMLARQIGLFVKDHRLKQNKTQERLAVDAGISRSTLSLLERGETVTLATLIRVLRVLDQLQVMDSFTIQKTINPMARAKIEQGKRHRARPVRKISEGNKNEKLNENSW